VLASTGLRDQPVLAGSFGQQPLPERVVELVGTAVEEILVFKIDFRVVPLAQRLRVEYRRRAAAEVFEQVAELGHERLVRDRVLVGRRKLRERLFERFRNVSSAKLSKLTELTRCRHRSDAGPDPQKTTWPTPQGVRRLVTNERSAPLVSSGDYSARSIEN